MNRFLAAAFFILAGSLLNALVLAQSPMPPPPYGDYPAHVMPEEFFDLSLRRGFPKGIREDRVLKEGLLAPSLADRLASAAFLRARNTGLIRLLPRGPYLTYHKKTKLISVGGAYYSFANLTHDYGHSSDIELHDDTLSSGFAGADYGMLTNLGDVSLEGISREDPRFAFISNYKPPKAETQARAEAQRFRLTGGVMIEGLLYRSSLPVQEKATYLLRSIIYRRSQPSDVLVAFRVVRKETDGSVIIAWKLLKNYHAPALNRNK